HTMLAAYHLAKSANPVALEGLRPLITELNIENWVHAKTAVFVGTAYGPDVPIAEVNGHRIHTPWGYIAWALAGERGLDLVKDAEAKWSNPGQAKLLELFRLSGPSLVLMDEVTTYGAQLDGVRQDNFLGFVQSLTEAAATLASKPGPGALIIGSIPQSEAEI